MFILSSFFILTALPSVQAVTETIVAFKGELGIHLQCTVSGDPKPELEWFYNGVNTKNSPLFYRTSDNGSLYIYVMRARMAGNYTCRASNIMGTANDTIRLNYGGMKYFHFYCYPLHELLYSSIFPCTKKTCFKNVRESG